MIDENRLLDELEYYISHTREDSGEHYAYKKCKELIERQPKINGCTCQNCMDDGK